MGKNKTTIVLSVILAIAVIAAIAFFILWNQSQSQVQQANLNFDITPAQMFANQFQILFQEHTYLLADLGRRSLTNTSSSSFNSTLTALNNNINQVGQLLTPIYGSNASEFISLWNIKTAQLINYSTSLKNNDPNALAYYNAAQSAYVPQVVAFWTSTANPYPVLSQELTQQLTSSTSGGVKAAIDDWYAGNYDQYYVDLAGALNSSDNYANIVSTAMIQQNPQLFQ
jgi:hypothetical protein